MDKAESPKHYRLWLFQALSLPVRITPGLSAALTLAIALMHITFLRPGRDHGEGFAIAVLTPGAIWLFNCALRRISRQKLIESPWINAGIVISLGILVGAVWLVLDTFVSRDPNANTSGYFYGGVFLVLPVYLAYSQVSFAGRGYFELKRELEGIKADLAHLTNDNVRLIDEAARQTRTATIRAFSESFEAIYAATKTKIQDEAVALVERMRDLELRPASKDLVQRLAAWIYVPAPRRVNNPLRLPDTFVLGEALNPLIFVWLTPLFIGGLMLTDGPGHALPALVYAVTEFSTWFGVKYLTRGLRLRTWLGICVLLILNLLVPALATSIEYGLTLRGFDIAEFVKSVAQNTQLSPVIIFAVAYLRSIGASLAHSRAELKLLNEQVGLLKVTVGLRIHALQRQFGYFLHGAVQSALNAAVLRLVRSQQSTADWNRFATDVASAETMVGQFEPQRLVLRDQIEQLKSVWEGVARVAFSCPAEVEVAIDGDSLAAFSANEIWREAVSNAVRHGSATAIDISVAREDEFIHLVVANNGSLPSAQMQGNLGLTLLDDLSSEWWFDIVENSPLSVRLHAKIPVLVAVG